MVVEREDVFQILADPLITGRWNVSLLGGALFFCSNNELITLLYFGILKVGLDRFAPNGKQPNSVGS